MADTDGKIPWFSAYETVHEGGRSRSRLFKVYKQYDQPDEIDTGNRGNGLASDFVGFLGDSLLIDPASDQREGSMELIGALIIRDLYFPRGVKGIDAAAEFLINNFEEGAIGISSHMLGGLMRVSDGKLEEWLQALQRVIIDRLTNRHST